MGYFHEPAPIAYVERISKRDRGKIWLEQAECMAQGAYEGGPYHAVLAPVGRTYQLESLPAWPADGVGRR